MNIPTSAFRPAALAAALLLGGCSAQLVREEAATQMREGRYESAVKVLEDGVARFPDSTMLRSALLLTKSEVLTRWITEATQLRVAGKFAQAQAVVDRALESEPRNERLLALRQELLAEERTHKLMEKANTQAGTGRRDLAIQTLDLALRESPRHAASTALRRQLEAELRAETGAGRIRLSELRPVTLDFRAAPLSAVLEAITRGSGVNFILDRDVKQDARVTLFLRSAAVEDALELITGANQLSRRVIDSQTVLVYPNTPEKHREHQEQVVRVFHLANADAKATAQLLKSMLRLKDPFVDERANMVAIRETPEIVSMAERLVALHDAGDAEVMLDVEILEIKTSRLTELGISVPSSVTLTPLAAAASVVGGVGGGGGAGLTVRSVRDINSDRIGLSVGNVSLSLRREVGDFNILANPRIRTKNREKARVVIGDRFPVVTSTTNATGFVSESVNYLDVGLKLDVEPIVSLDDDVTIKLALEVSALAGSIRTAGGSLAYQVGTRNANTTLRLRDGETQVLAGLISNDDRSSANRIPGLGDLPLAGRLFSNQKDEYQRTELMLAITPRVLRGAPRPDISQAEMWVGTENSPRLKTAPRTVAARADTPVAIGPGAAALGLVGRAEARDAAPSAAPVQAVWKSAPVIKAGQIHVIALHLVSASALRGALAELNFPTAQVEVLEVAEGGFFKQAGGTTNFTHSIDAAAGRVNIGVLRSDQGGASGDAAFAEVKVRMKAAGTADIGITSLRPVGAGGPAQASTPSVLKLTAQ